MTHLNKSTSQPDQVQLVKRMVIGAGIGLVLISFFLLSVREPNPDWGKLWMIRPLIIVSLAGAVGGGFNYVIIHFHRQVGVNKAVALGVSVLVFIIGLWLGFVLGLVGTLWD